MASIVIYDSGVGGLSIYQEIARRCSGHQLVFLSDNQAFPYGTKSETELSKRVLSVSEQLARKYAPDVLVIACNTASTLTLPLLRERFDFPIVGVVPAIKPAVKLSKTKKIGLLATPATVARDYTKELVAEFAQQSEVLMLGSHELVQIAEDKLYGRVVSSIDIGEILTPFLAAEQLDTTVLACTHFPLLKSEIAQIFKDHHRSMNLVDSGAAIAKRVEYLIEPFDNGQSSSVAAFTQALDNSHMSLTLEQMGFNKIDKISV